MKKPKKPKLPAAVKRPFNRARAAEERMTDALGSVPRITNDNLTEHREEVLGSARKYIYPLQQSKHRIVRVSLGLFLAALIIFFAYCGLALYKFQSTSGFIYDVTRVIPFPVAKAGKTWVSYESYLFELRRNMHYYHTQQQTDFSSKDGKTQLARLRQQAIDQVVTNAYVKQLASTNKVSVSAREVDNEVELVRSQNRLGSSDRVFHDVLNQFWGWNEDDFRRELKQQLLQQNVVAKLDSATSDRAKAALAQLQGGADFAALAGQVSDDVATKGNGGQYPNPITPTSRDIAPQVTAELFKLKAGEVSGIIDTHYTQEIVKVIDTSSNSLHAAHIQFTYRDINTYLKPLQDKQKTRHFVKV